MVLVIIVHHVPLVDHQVAHALGPHVHGTADQLIPGERFEFLAVHTMGDAVVLPGEIVAPLAHKTAVRLVIGRERQLPVAHGQQEDARLFGREIGLKQQLIEDTVVIDVHGLDQQILIGTFGAHVDLAHIVYRQKRAQPGGIQHDGFVRPGDVDGVADGDGGARRGSERRGQGGEQD